MLDIASIETELIVNPKGSVRICFDLERRLLRWRESNRWNRNFTRSISLLELNEIRNFLATCEFEKWPASDPTASSRDKSFHRQWSLRLCDEQGKLLFSHLLRDRSPDYFSRFCEGISHFCRQPFNVSD